MRGAAVMVMAAILLAVPAGAKEKTRYQYGDRVYETYEQCLEAKRKAKKKGAIVGAVGGAVTGALVGGNFGETALASGVGALAGGAIGKSTKKC
ncbi:hypothetical protein [Sandaracinobacteroides saxicola]|uniref:17 kDa surface antigen n=1 Tax=Sandaracinobacteroides saxicola TaxID=2759707 RepID=A0A7G5IK59_9SPHN|nr:hypothetical protein [Sandaracinobacteroides saxicola]QMW23751.1 hypothetical protein H3309_04510 [Sandaracinobacteroides saxicola]